VLVDMFLDDLDDDIHGMLCDQNYDNYQGLDRNRDTIAEVETAIRFFPEVLSRRKDVIWASDDMNDSRWIDAPENEGDYPIQCLLNRLDNDGKMILCNLKAAPFIVVLARLGMDLNQFEEEERGGLLREDRNERTTLPLLIQSDFSNYGDDHNQLVDNVYLTQMIQLRQIDLFMKEDIREQDLVGCVCEQPYFSENKFQFLVEWDPAALVQPGYNGCLPLHCAAPYLDRLRIVFDYCIRYYPYKKGISLLFTKDDDGDTPFQEAYSWGKDEVMEIIEEVLARYQSEETTQLNIVDALTIAAIDENVYIDCVYFLLRRHPDILVDLLRSESTTTNSNNCGNDDGDNDSNIINGNCNNDGNNGRNDNPGDDHVNDGDHDNRYDNRDDNNDDGNHENDMGSNSMLIGEEDTSDNASDNASDIANANANERKRKRDANK